MRQKKVLLYGKAKSLNDFFHSNCDNEFAPVAVVSEDANFLKLRNNFGLPPVEVFAPENFPKFIYSMIDGVVLIDEDKRKEKIIFLLTQGVALKKIIVWNGNGNLEFVTNFQDQNACLTEGLEFHLLSDGQIICKLNENFFPIRKENITILPRRFIKITSRKIWTGITCRLSRKKFSG